ncbi:MAG: dihydroorotate dehydrogenase electron transfer subunit [Fibrobacterota bacterium]
MKDCMVHIRENTQLSRGFYRLSFDWRSDKNGPRAGQFFELRIPGATDPLLRRPFAFSAYDDTTHRASCIYEVRGKTTKILRDAEPGMSIQIMAPLGNAFYAPTNNVIALGGGIGLGPILFAAQQFSQNHAVTLVTGFRSAEYIPHTAYDPSVPAIICTDDGSRGFSGNVIEYLKTLPEKDLENTTILACGPHPMLAAAAEFARARSLLCLVSLEEMMACGIGACMGCVVDRADGGKARVCKEGPIFSAEEVRWT